MTPVEPRTDQESAEAAQPATQTKASSSRTAEMPFFAPVAILVACAALSIADLAFLNDVIGQVLDLEQRPSIIISGALGLAGLLFMIHLGYSEAEAHHPPGKASKVVHIGIWIALGVAISAARLFSGKILELGSEDGVIQMIGLEVRQQDVVFAPIMLLMYLIAGLGARDATKSIFLNTGFHKFRESRADKKRAEEVHKQRAMDKQRERIATVQEEREAKRREMVAKQAERKTAKSADAERQQELKREREAAVHQEKLETLKKREELERERLELQKQNVSTEQRALEIQKERAEKRRVYHNAQQSYLQLKSGFQARTQLITEQIALIEKLDAEIAAVNSTLANTVKIIDESENSAQNAAALKIHAKTKEPVAQLKTVIANFNAERSHD
ncbi:hypothetical protein H9L21_11305 [Aeromicrobium senzhongii]|uniref:DUF2637 domain-containing protein n=1 Tax=Aeromicrobium senzhongii TaxID=2663859 RepID=A0ABX6SWW5_9ACTN|nr:hypothetical protein [Aeromicrobium senzhongii]MTB89036.1 hypothetical protein [Aeromicrobium senzhongii]QNL93690.1 hypothetical protein H9L21_11305 [Aeromicrobium senzhongii]